MAIPISSHFLESLSVQIGKGETSNPNEFPFMANIRKFENNLHVCGGTIISTMLIVTAAHCLESENLDYTGYRVVAGQHNLNVIDNTVEQRRKIAKVYVHPNYIAGNKKNPPFDIAVILVKEPFKFNTKVNCLNPLTNSLNASSGKFGRIIGWGEVGHGERSTILRKAHIELMNRKMCNSYISLIPGNVFLNMYESIICSTKSVKSICSGDSGGPMVCKNNRGLSSLCGVSAFSPDSCGQGIAIESYFTSVPYFYTWIKHFPMKDPEIVRRNNNSKESTIYCGVEEFLCNNEKTIPVLYQCDNENDCGDASDEIGCFPCGDNEFKCYNEKCLPANQVCNAQNECGDGSDEFGCGMLCHQAFFLCASKKYCLNGTSVCDGVNDCHDGSDESNCGNCEINQFRCKNGNCIDLTHVCDYESDCKDGSDEFNCETCKNKFRCKNDQCIPANSVCNEIVDCEDGSDETDCSKCHVNCLPSPNQSGGRTTTTTTRAPKTTSTTSRTTTESFSFGLPIKKVISLGQNGQKETTPLAVDRTSEKTYIYNEDLIFAMNFRDQLKIRKYNDSNEAYVYLQNWLEENSDLVLLNFVRYAEFDLERAERHLKKTVEWRRENEVEKIFNWSYPTDFSLRYPWSITGFTQKNEPVLHMSMGYWNVQEAVNRGQKQDLLKWATFMLETATKEASLKIDPESGLPVGNFIFIIDYDHFKLSLVASMRAMRTAGSYARIFETIYPLYATNTLVIRAPSYLYLLYEGIKRLLTPPTIATLSFADNNGNNWKRILHEKIPHSALPADLGGSQ